MGQYSVLAPIKLLVNAGDNVIPGQPIAVFNKPADRYTVLFSVIYYLDDKKASANSNFGASQPLSPYVYLPVFFYDADNKKAAPLSNNKQYTIAHPKEMIALELSKKDKKKLGIQ